jgi:hypothetical protein
MNSTGWRAAASRASAAVTSASLAPGRCGRPRCERAGRSTSASSWNTLYGMSRFTGPGRPVTIVSRPWRSASGSMSTRVGWKARLTTGRSTCAKSAWLCLYSSWNGARLCWLVGTLAVMAMKADESDSAVASDITRLADARPGAGERGHRPVLDAEVGIGHVAGALFVAREIRWCMATGAARLALSR